MGEGCWLLRGRGSSAKGEYCSELKLRASEKPKVP